MKLLLISLGTTGAASAPLIAAQAADSSNVPDMLLKMAYQVPALAVLVALVFFFLRYLEKKDVQFQDAMHAYHVSDHEAMTKMLDSNTRKQQVMSEQLTAATREASAVIRENAATFARSVERMEHSHERLVMQISQQCTTCKASMHPQRDAK